jgi:hypothetical protein
MRNIVVLVGAPLLVAAGWFVWKAGRSAEIVEAHEAPAQATLDTGFDARRDETVSAGASETIPSRPAENGDKVRGVSVPPPSRAEPEDKPARSAEDAARMRAAIEKTVRRIYEDVGRDLQLDEDATEALLRSIVERQVSLFSPSEETDPVMQYAAYNEKQAQFQREIEARLGTARAGALANYERTMNARFEVEALRGVLEKESMPLTETQRKSMIEDAIARGAYLQERIFSGAEADSAVMQEAMASIEQRDQKLMSAARGVLNSKQLERYEAYLEARHAGLEATLQRMQDAPRTPQ